MGIQVQLPGAFKCTDSAVIGYPGGSHMPQGTNGAWIKASNDGSNWVTAATWTTHPGCSVSLCCVANDGSDMGYNKIAGDYDNYKIEFSNSVKETAYSYWRVGGNSHTNNYLLIY